MYEHERIQYREYFHGRRLIFLLKWKVKHHFYLEICSNCIQNQIKPFENGSCWGKCWGTSYRKFFGICLMKYHKNTPEIVFFSWIFGKFSYIPIHDLDLNDSSKDFFVHWLKMEKLWFELIFSHFGLVWMKNKLFTERNREYRCKGREIAQLGAFFMGQTLCRSFKSMIRV